MSNWTMPRFKDGYRVTPCVGFWQIDLHGPEVPYKGVHVRSLDDKHLLPALKVLADTTGRLLSADEIRASA